MKKALTGIIFLFKVLYLVPLKKKEDIRPKA